MKSTDLKPSWLIFICLLMLGGGCSRDDARHSAEALSPKIAVARGALESLDQLRVQQQRIQLGQTIKSYLTKVNKLALLGPATTEQQIEALDGERFRELAYYARQTNILYAQFLQVVLINRFGDIHPSLELKRLNQTADRHDAVGSFLDASKAFAVFSDYMDEVSGLHHLTTIAISQSREIRKQAMPLGKVAEAIEHSVEALNEVLREFSPEFSASFKHSTAIGFTERIFAAYKNRINLALELQRIRIGSNPIEALYDAKTRDLMPVLTAREFLLRSIALAKLEFELWICILEGLSDENLSSKS